MNMLKKIGVTLGTMGVALGLSLAAAPAASAEPSPGMARMTYHCHYAGAGVWWCHTASW